MPVYLTNSYSLAHIEQLCKAKLVTFLQWQPFEQVGVGGYFPVITNEFEGILQYYQWGLVPVWAKTVAMGKNMGKTKWENLQEKTALQAIYQYKRCIIPVTAFSIYTSEKKESQQWITAPMGTLFYLAGLWSIWGEGLHTFSILTQQVTKENNTIDMPLQVPIHKLPVWLKKGTVDLTVVKGLL